MSDSTRWMRLVRWQTMARAALTGIGLLVVGCGGREKENTAMRDTSQVAPPADTSSAARPESAAAVPADTSRPTPAVKESTSAPPKKATTAGRRADTSARKKPASSAAAEPKATAPSAAAKPPAAQDTGTQTAEAPLRDAYHPAPLDTVPQQVYEGWKQFNLNCARCHGEDVLGTTIAPHLIVSLKPDGPINTKELFMSTVCSGRPEKGMPAWCSLGLGMDKIEQIYTYVKGRSDGKIHPGRPAVRQQG